MTLKLGRNSETGKLLRCSDGRLLRGCCPGDSYDCQSGPQAFCSQACGQPGYEDGQLTPASVTVNISGISVTDFPALWLKGILVNGPGQWCNGHESYIYQYSFSGSAVSGSYVVPLQWTRYYTGIYYDPYRYYACTGYVDVPFSGTLTKYYGGTDDYGCPASLVIGDVYSEQIFTAIRVRVYAQYESGVGSRVCVQLSVNEGQGEGSVLFQGCTEYGPYSCFSATIENSKQTPHENCPTGPSPCFNNPWHNAWGGTAVLTPSGTFLGKCYLHHFDDVAWHPAAKIVYLPVYVQFALEEAEVTLIATYRMSYGNKSFIGEACIESDWGDNMKYAHLTSPVLFEKPVGPVTVEILDLHHDGETTFWDQSMDLVSPLYSGVLGE